MYALAHPRHDGPLRRRWRARRGWRRAGLAERLSVEVTRLGGQTAAPDWYGILCAEQLGRELEWADASLADAVWAGRG